MAVAAAIDVAEVTKAFDRSGRELLVLDGLNLRVEPGEFVALIGPSGCGKSTLLRSVCGLIDVDQGTISINGATPAAARRNKQFGFVPQSPALLDWKTVRDNVQLLLDVNRSGPADMAEVDRLIERVGLTSAANALPRELSGGMKQRVSLARAFALRAPVLIMDEPFSSLDEITRAEMRFLLLELWRETAATVLFVTHNIDEAVVLSDRVVVMAGQPGRVIIDEHIDLARPRAQGIEDDPRFHDYAAALRRGLRAGEPIETSERVRR